MPKANTTTIDIVFRYTWYAFWIAGAALAFADVLDYELTPFTFIACALLGAAWGFFVCGALGIILGPALPKDPLGINMQRTERIYASIGAICAILLMTLFYFTEYQNKRFLRDTQSVFYISLGGAILTSIAGLITSAFMKNYSDYRKGKR